MRAWLALMHDAPPHHPSRTPLTVRVRAPVCTWPGLAHAEFISDTGITKIRDARNEEEEKKTTKQRQRDKMQPKMGKINIDYQILHDAFFKFQTKPKLTQHGDMCVPLCAACVVCVGGGLSGLVLWQWQWVSLG